MRVAQVHPGCFDGNRRLGNLRRQRREGGLGVFQRLLSRFGVGLRAGVRGEKKARAIKRRLRLVQVCLGADLLRLDVGQRRSGRVQIVGLGGGINVGDDVAFLHAVAHIDLQRSNRARCPGTDIDLYERSQRAGGQDGLFNIAQDGRLGQDRRGFWLVEDEHPSREARDNYDQSQPSQYELASSRRVPSANAVWIVTRRRRRGGRRRRQRPFQVDPALSAVGGCAPSSGRGQPPRVMGTGIAGPMGRRKSCIDRCSSLETGSYPLSRAIGERRNLPSGPRRRDESRGPTGSLNFADDEKDGPTAKTSRRPNTN